MSPQLTPIFTIGHSNHELLPFIGLLTRHGITAVADVRSQPVSRIPHFNRDVLAMALAARGIKYLPLGRELGARRNEPDCYVDGRAVYERIALLPLFQAGIEHLREAAGQYLIALMCAEKEPLDCHRTLLICRHLRGHGLRIRHILADSRLEEHDQTEQRLMRLMGMTPEQGDLYATAKELIEEAYEARGKQIAYLAGLEEVPA